MRAGRGAPRTIRLGKSLPGSDSYREAGEADTMGARRKTNGVFRFAGGHFAEGERRKLIEEGKL